MASASVRGCLRRAADELDDVRETMELSPAHAAQLERLASQIRYYCEQASSDPETLAYPDPTALDSIRDHLGAVVVDADGDTAARIERARHELLEATSWLKESLEKQRGTRDGPD